MKKDLRNDFTDALNEEILSRKIFDKAKNFEKENIFLSEVENVVSQETKISKSESKAKKNPPKFSEEKILQSEIKTSEKISAANDFEERVFAEAENDFYEEKVSEVEKRMKLKAEEKKNFAPVFHSKSIEEDIREKNEEKISSEDFELHRKLTRAEVAGVSLSLIMFFYSYVTLDKPLFFISVSLMVHLVRPLVGGFFGKYNRAVQNAMRSFSLVLFFGAILFIFI